MDYPSSGMMGCADESAHGSGCLAPDRSVLELHGFGVAFGDRVVLSEIDLQVPARGVSVLMGPGGTGKSTLLRTLAGYNAANPHLRTWGEAVYAGRPLTEVDAAPAMVQQSARLMMASIFENLMHELPQREQLRRVEQRALVTAMLEEAGLAAYASRLDDPVVRLPLGVQRHLAVLRLAATAPPLLCVDEPTTGLPDDEADALLDYIAREAGRRAMLVVLHNQAQARQLGGHTALLAGGRVQEHCATEKFFTAPRTPAAREFIRNGNCSVPAPDAEAEELDVETAPPPPLPEPARRAARQASGPRGFLWLKRGRLAGTPRPGIVADLEHDLEALKRVGVTVLVSLTETPMDSIALAAHGIRHIASPIRDMAAPSIAQALDLCERIAHLINEGEVIAVHCRAGLGRTGTILAAHLIHEGRGALDALEAVRRVEPKWVQSEEQVAFLEDFAHAVANGSRQPRSGNNTAR